MELCPLNPDDGRPNFPCPATFCPKRKKSATDIWRGYFAFVKTLLECVESRTLGFKPEQNRGCTFPVPGTGERCRRLQRPSCPVIRSTQGGAFPGGQAGIPCGGSNLNPESGGAGSVSPPASHPPEGSGAAGPAIVSGKSCGSCTLCCTVMGVPELKKRPWEPCRS